MINDWLVYNDCLLLLFLVWWWLNGLDFTENKQTKQQTTTKKHIPNECFGSRKKKEIQNRKNTMTHLSLYIEWKWDFEEREREVCEWEREYQHPGVAKKYNSEILESGFFWLDSI